MMTSPSSVLSMAILPESNYNGSLPSSYGPPPINSSELIELDELELEYIFDRLYIRVLFIFLYSIVFALCFFGNLMVILVVTLHWKMSQTKICLANLALADLCVGIFCVYQNLSVYLINSWIFGQFLCKMYHFVNSLSHTASIMILVVICVERYLAILHPFKCKQLLTIKRLWLLIVCVWLASAVYCSPKLYYIGLVKVMKMDGEIEIICAANRTLYDSRTFDMIHFVLLFLIPLVSMSIMYFRVGVVLWTSSKGRLETPTNSTPTPPSHRRQSLRMRIFRNPTKEIGDDMAAYFENDYKLNNLNNKKYRFCNSFPSRSQRYFVEANELKIISIVNINETGGDYTTTHKCPLHCDYQDQHGCSSTIPTLEPAVVVKNGHHKGISSRPRNGPVQSQTRVSSKCSQAKNVRGGRDALRIRRQVVRMLIYVVCSFALFNFPVHLRKMFLYFSHWKHDSIYATLLTPVTNLISVAGSGLNPIIYAFMSRSFRTSFSALLKCRNSLELPNNEIASTSEVLNLKSVAGDKITRRSFRNSRRNREFIH